jgi:O-methyltransferase
MMLSERFKKVGAGLIFGRFSLLFEALGENAHLYRWLQSNRPFPCFSDRFDLYQHVQTRYLETTSMDYLEFGVFRGDSILKWAEINPHSKSRFVGFDSFEGLPEEWVAISRRGPKGSYSAGGIIPVTSDSRIQFVKGLFADTLPNFLGSLLLDSRLVVHIDADLYSSTLYVLTTINHLITTGSIIIFDEFSNPLNEWKAFRAYASAFGRSFRVIGASGSYYTQIALEVIE